LVSQKEWVVSDGIGLFQLVPPFSRYHWIK